MHGAGDCLCRESISEGSTYRMHFLLKPICEEVRSMAQSSITLCFRALTFVTPISTASLQIKRDSTIPLCPMPRWMRLLWLEPT